MEKIKKVNRWLILAMGLGVLAYVVSLYCQGAEYRAAALSIMPWKVMIPTLGVIGLAFLIWGAVFKQSGKYWVRIVNIVWVSIIIGIASYFMIKMNLILPKIILICCIVIGATFLVLNIISLFKPKESSNN